MFIRKPDVKWTMIAYTRSMPHRTDAIVIILKAEKVAIYISIVFINIRLVSFYFLNIVI